MSSPLGESVPSVETEEEQMTVHIVREPGQGLGISIAGGLGSTPYKGEDEVGQMAHDEHKKNCNG